MTKSQRHNAIRNRARNALLNLYHNATPHYPSLDDSQARQFESWFEDAAQFEIEYMSDGGAYGNNYAKTLRANCNAGKYNSTATQNRYIAWKMRSMREDRSKEGAWECICEFGKLYQYGRGGRTLAPNKLIRNGGGNRFSIIEDYVEETCIEYTTRFIKIVESFNAFCESWCKSVPEQWDEYYKEEFGGADINDVSELSDT